MKALVIAGGVLQEGLERFYEEVAQISRSGGAIFCRSWIKGYDGHESGPYRTKGV